MIRRRKTAYQGYTPHKYAHIGSNRYFYGPASFNYLEAAFFLLEF